MSFKVAISAVSIANEALAMLPEDPIVALDEQSLAGRECQRVYKPVVAEMLETHHWGLATKRVALVGVLNDRPSEWRYAYAKPADMAFPVRMAPNGMGYQGWFLNYDGAFWTLGGLRAMIQVGNTIYSMLGSSTIEYTSFNITEADFTNMFKRMVVLAMAARICPPITKSATRTQALLAQAEMERMRAIANDMNRDMPSYGNNLTESAYARFGMSADQSLLGGGYALDPVALPSVTGYLPGDVVDHVPYPGGAAPDSPTWDEIEW